MEAAKHKPMSTNAATHKSMSTIIFFSTSHDDHVKSVEALVEALRADGRCEHKICFRPVALNIFQLIRGVKDKLGNMQPIGCHEILYLPSTREQEIARLEDVKNVVFKRNSMCYVNNEERTKKLIDWLLEETEEIEL